MRQPVNFYIFFHMLVFLFRKYLEVIHTAQFVAIFYLETVDEVTHASFASLIWLLHPFDVFRESRARLVKKTETDDSSEGCRVTNWFASRALKLFTGLNLVPIQAQATEAEIYESMRAIDVRKSLDSISNLPNHLFQRFKMRDDAEAEISASPEPEEGGWFFINLWEFPKKSKAMFSDLKAKRGTAGRATSAPASDSRSMPGTRSDKIEELGELDSPVASEGPAPKTSTGGALEHSPSGSDQFTAPTFSEIKTIWGDRIRRRRPH